MPTSPLSAPQTSAMSWHAPWTLTCCAEDCRKKGNRAASVIMPKTIMELLAVTPVPTQTNGRCAINSHEVCRLSGATYRQLVFWTARGYIKPVKPPAGTGVPLEWSVEDAVQVKVLKHLVAAGLRPDKAARTLPLTSDVVEVGIDSEYVAIRVNVEAIREYVKANV